MAQQTIIVNDSPFPDPQKVAVWIDLPTDQMVGSVKLAALAGPRMVGRFRWCPQLGWLSFDGSKWVTDAEHFVLGEVVQTIKAYTLDLVTASPAGLNAENLRELRELTSSSCQNQTLKILRGHEGIFTPDTAFDPMPTPGSPWLVPCANGITVELHTDGTHTSRPTTARDMNTHAVCAYDPTAPADKIMEAFALYQPDEAVRTFLLQQWARGLSGMGSETFTVNLGESGGNGKGTMQTVLTSTAGDYAGELPVEVILRSSARSARTEFRSELAALRGRRLLFADEPEEGARYDTATLKKITGGNIVSGRGMGKEAVDFELHILFQLAANNRPSWSADGGMERRYIEIMWNYKISESDMRENFKEDLKAQTSGFLNVILAHWTGPASLVMPDVIRQTTAAGSRASSPAAKFVDEALESTPEDMMGVRAMRLYGAYTEWCKQNNVRPVSSTKIGNELKRLKLDKETDRYGTYYPGIKIVEGYEPRPNF